MGKLLRAVAYRLRQFWRLLTIRTLPAEMWAEVTAVLTLPQQQLFRRLNGADQWHSVQVLRMLRDAGHTHPDLQVAALLHDVGKTRLKVTLWHRTLIVLAQAFVPGRLAAWGEGDPQGWQRPFVVKAQHPAWSAEMAAAVGCTPLALALIRRHQDKLPQTAVSVEDELLRLLQWADDQN